jgi:hypothetical protein
VCIRATLRTPIEMGGLIPGLSRQPAAMSIRSGCTICLTKIFACHSFFTLRYVENRVVKRMAQRASETIAVSKDQSNLHYEGNG